MFEIPRDPEKERFNAEVRREKAAEQRQFDFAREQNTFGAVANPEDDHIFLQQQEKNADLLKWQQDLFEELEQLKRDLRNEFKTADGEWKRKVYCIGQGRDGRPIYKPMPPLANEYFISMMETECRPLMSRNMMMSNFSEQRILDMLKHTSNTIADNMADNYDKYGIEFVNFDHVVRLIKNVIIPAPFRALNDGERRHQRTIAKRIESFSESQSQPKPMQNKKFLGLFG